MGRFLPTKEITLRASGLAEITSDWSSTKRINQGYSRIAVLINVSAITDSPSVVATIEAYDRVSNTYMAVAKSAAITGTGAYILTRAFTPTRALLLNVWVGERGVRGRTPLPA